jgi:hypothetical protein
MGRFKRRQGVNHLCIGIGKKERQKRRRTGPGIGTISPEALMRSPEYAQRIVQAILSMPRRFQRKAV